MSKSKVVNNKAYSIRKIRKQLAVMIDNKNKEVNRHISWPGL